MSDVALIIIYNHRFDTNINILEKVYKGKFSCIYHLMPFYDGDKTNVIPVYENSHYFQGYIAQGFKQYFDKSIKHFLFIGDDLLLNPVITENNYSSYFNIDESACFLPGFLSIHENNNNWPRVKEAYHYKPALEGLEIKGILPVYDDALKAFNKHHLQLKSLNYDQLHKYADTDKNYKSTIKYRIKKSIYNKKKYDLSYPLVGSYADIIVVSASAIEKFVNYCAVFAATKLFVELAIPTAMVLASEKIVTEKNTTLKGKALWSDDDFKILNKYDQKLSALMNDFPLGNLYLHPVKLSKWKIDI